MGFVLAARAVIAEVAGRVLLVLRDTEQNKGSWSVAEDLSRPMGHWARLQRGRRWWSPGYASRSATSCGA